MAPIKALVRELIALLPSSTSSQLDLIRVLEVAVVGRRTELESSCVVVPVVVAERPAVGDIHPRDELPSLCDDLGAPLPPPVPFAPATAPRAAASNPANEPLLPPLPPAATTETAAAAAAPNMILLARLIICRVIDAWRLRPRIADGFQGCGLVVALMRAMRLAEVTGESLGRRDLVVLASARSPTAVAVLTARLVSHRAALHSPMSWKQGWEAVLEDAHVMDPPRDDKEATVTAAALVRARTERNICLGSARCRRRWRNLRRFVNQLASTDDDAAVGAGLGNGDGWSGVDDDGGGADVDAAPADGGAADEIDAIDDATPGYGALHAARSARAALGELEPIGLSTPIFTMETDMKKFLSSVGIARGTARPLVAFRDALASALRQLGATRLATVVRAELSAPEVAVMACEFERLPSELGGDRDRFARRAAALWPLSSNGADGLRRWRDGLDWNEALQRTGQPQLPNEVAGVLYNGPKALKAWLHVHERPLSTAVPPQPSPAPLAAVRPPSAAAAARPQAAPSTPRRETAGGAMQPPVAQPLRKRPRSVGAANEGASAAEADAPAASAGTNTAAVVFGVGARVRTRNKSCPRLGKVAEHTLGAKQVIIEWALDSRVGGTPQSVHSAAVVAGWLMALEAAT